MKETPCKNCIAFALCNAKGPFNKWPELNILYDKYPLLSDYLRENSPGHHLLQNDRLYETLFLFSPWTRSRYKWRGKEES
jgi:hypothetical protein